MKAIVFGSGAIGSVVKKALEEKRHEVVTVGRKLRLRVEEASLVDDFGHFVRTRFPYPVALRWRRVQASAGDDDPGHAYLTRGTISKLTMPHSDEQRSGYAPS